jgi:AcrR family transcriptional regulator
MATRLSRPEQVQRNRGLVLEAARRVFLERGYAGATLEAIADEAGFSKGVVYSQFAGKPDLLLALLEARIEERAAENLAVTDGLAGVEGLHALLDANARRTHEAPAWSRLLIEFRITASRDPELNARYAAAHAVGVGRFGDLIGDLAARGGLRFVHGPQRAARLIFALDAGVTLERIADPDGLPTEVLDDLVSGLTEPI